MSRPEEARKAERGSNDTAAVGADTAADRSPRRSQASRQTTGRPTVRDVARVAGVSIKTVSRVVNDEAGVHPATAERVLAAIDQLGFRRNLSARNLRRGSSTGTIGLVLEDVGNPFYSGVTRAVEEIARLRGRQVITGSSDEDKARERELSLEFCSRRVDGLLIVPAGLQHGYLVPEMRAGRRSSSWTGQPGTSWPTPCWWTTSVARARPSRTWRRSGTGASRSSATRRTSTPLTNGCAATARAARGPASATTSRWSSWARTTRSRCARRCSACGTPPTRRPRWSTGNNRITEHVVRALAVRPVRPALVGFDDFELAASLVPPVTVVRADREAMGRLGAELLLRRMDGWDGDPQRMVLPTEIVPRGSGELAPDR